MKTEENTLEIERDHATLSNETDLVTKKPDKLPGFVAYTIRMLSLIGILVSASVLNIAEHGIHRDIFTAIIPSILGTACAGFLFGGICSVFAKKENRFVIVVVGAYVALFLMAMATFGPSSQ